MKATKVKKLISVIVVCSLFISTSFIPTRSSVKEDLKRINLSCYYIDKELTPGLISTKETTWVLDHMFKGLYTIDDNGSVVLDIAKSAKVSDDGLVWTFGLNDFRWSSRNKGIAQDFVESYIFNLEHEDVNRYGSYLWIIKNGQNFSEGLVTRDEVGVKAINDNTLEITLEGPIPYLPQLLTLTHFYPIDSKNASLHSDWYMSAKRYSSNGPFTLKTYNYDKNILLTKNKYYYNNELTKIDEINFSIVSDEYTEAKMYVDGKLDYLYYPIELTSLDINSDELEYINSFGTNYVQFNTEIEPFNNVKVRKALSMAVDREFIIDALVVGDMKAYTITPSGIIDENNLDYLESFEKKFEEDTILAKKLLKEGLAEEGFNINDWTFTYSYNYSSKNAKVAEELKQMWLTNLGVECELQEVDFVTLMDMQYSGDFEVVRSGWLGDYADPLTFLELFTTENNLNYGRWSNELYDELIKKSNINNDRQSRLEQLKDAEQILIEEAVLLPIYHYTDKVAKKPYLVDVFKPVNKYPSFEFADIIKSQ